MIDYAKHARYEIKIWRHNFWNALLDADWGDVRLYGGLWAKSFTRKFWMRRFGERTESWLYEQGRYVEMLKETQNENSKRSV